MVKKTANQTANSTEAINNKKIAPIEKFDLKGIEIPPLRKRDTSVVYQWEKLNVGEGFTVPKEKADAALQRARTFTYAKDENGQRLRPNHRFMILDPKDEADPDRVIARVN